MEERSLLVEGFLMKLKLLSSEECKLLAKLEVPHSLLHRHTEVSRITFILNRSQQKERESTNISY